MKAAFFFATFSAAGRLPAPAAPRPVPTPNLVEVDRWIDGRWHKVMVERTPIICSMCGEADCAEPGCVSDARSRQ